MRQECRCQLIALWPIYPRSNSPPAYPEFYVTEAYGLEDQDNRRIEKGAENNRVEEAIRPNQFFIGGALLPIFTLSLFTVPTRALPSSPP